MVKFSVTVSRLLLAMLILSGVFSSVSITEAEDLSFSTEDEDRALAKKLANFAEIFREKADQTYRGVLFGNILSVDPQHRFIYVKARERDLPRIIIYTDKKTIFTKSDVGFRRRVKPQAAIEGARIAVRLFIKQGVVLADEIFLVQEEFEPPSRYEKKKFAARSAAAPAAGEKKKEEGGGGHH